jgi:hypothetical protein
LIIYPKRRISVRFPSCEFFNFFSRSPTPQSFPTAVSPYDAQPIPKIMSEACLASGLCAHCFNKGITASTNIVKPVSQNSSGIRAYLAVMAPYTKVLVHLFKIVMTITHCPVHPLAETLGSIRLSNPNSISTPFRPSTRFPILKLRNKHANRRFISIFNLILVPSASFRSCCNIETARVRTL